MWSEPGKDTWKYDYDRKKLGVDDAPFMWSEPGKDTWKYDYDRKSINN
jgi:hypothetical protein